MLEIVVMIGLHGTNQTLESLKMNSKLEGRCHLSF